MKAAKKILDSAYNMAHFLEYLEDLSPNSHIYYTKARRQCLFAELLCFIKKYRYQMVVEFDDKKYATKFFKKYPHIISGYINYDSKDLRRYFALLGKDFEYAKAPAKKVLAIVHAYNEADIIEQTIRYLMEQGVNVLLLDNYSTDNTYNIGKRLQKEFGARLQVDHFPSKKPSGDNYEWAKQLAETERLAKKLDYDWFIHYDADEIREAPFDGVTLQEFISFVDLRGYNAIENTVIDFRMTSRKDDIFSKDVYYEFGTRPGHFLQTKTWKKCADINLTNSGGHVATFDGKKAYPLKVLCRHYPLRSIDQAKRKIFEDRLPRFKKEQKKYGWHTQYSTITNEDDFIYEKTNLQKYSKVENEKYRMQLISGIGLKRD